MNLNQIKSLTEDLEKIGLDSFDLGMAGIVIESEQDDKSTAKCDDDDDVDVDDDDDDMEEADASDVVDAAEECANYCLSQMFLEDIDYGVDDFASDLTESVGLKIASMIHDGYSLEEAAKEAIQITLSAYAELSDIAEEMQTESIVGLPVIHGSGTRLYNAQSIASDEDSSVAPSQFEESVNQEAADAMERFAVIAAKRSPAFRGEVVAYEESDGTSLAALRGLLAESKSNASNLSGIRSELAEAYDRITQISFLMGDFFARAGLDEDHGYCDAMATLAESCVTRADGLSSVSESSIDEAWLSEHVSMVQKYSKALNIAIGEYDKYRFDSGE